MTVHGLVGRVNGRIPPFDSRWGSAHRLWANLRKVGPKMMPLHAVDPQFGSELYHARQLGVVDLHKGRLEREAAPVPTTSGVLVAHANEGPHVVQDGLPMRAKHHTLLRPLGRAVP